MTEASHPRYDGRPVGEARCGSGSYAATVGIVTTPAVASAFTRTADLAAGTAAVANLCRYDIGC